MTINYETSGTFDGRFVDQDRFTPLKAGSPTRTRVDEIVVNERPQRHQLHVGQRLDSVCTRRTIHIPPTFTTNHPRPRCG